MTAGRQAVAAYFALLGWQPVWLLLLPPPAGPRHALLALLATLPLLLPLRGIAAGRPRTMTWGGFLALPYFIVGVMEAWSNPGMRPAALVQVLLSLGYVVMLVRAVRRRG